MKSDVDIMEVYDNQIKVVLHRHEVKASRGIGENMTVVQVQRLVSLLPQCCILPVVHRHALEKPVFSSTEFRQIFVSNSDEEGENNPNRMEVLCPVSIFKRVEDMLGSLSLNVKPHGPAVTMHGFHDNVHAIHCPSLPENCLILFTRPTPGHWPKQAIIKKAKECGVFLMSPGNLGNRTQYDKFIQIAYMTIKYDAEFVDIQWRISTNMIERLLMFDINMVQMRAYVIIKMIRKEMLKPLVDDRLCTFHLKTALLFTVEQFPEHVWGDNNLVQCVLYCLNTLRRFMRRRYCPHYTISSVNLFEGKLEFKDFDLLQKELTKIIDMNLTCIDKLRMDNVGERLSDTLIKCKSQLPSREHNRSYIISDLVDGSLSTDLLLSRCREIYMNANLVEAILKKWTMKIKYELERAIQYIHELEFVLNGIYSDIASIQASRCITNKMPISENITKMYRDSISGENMSCVLKYVSMLVCTRQFEKAESLLEHAEKNIKADMVEISLFRMNQFRFFNLKHFSTPAELYMACLSKFILNVRFSIHDINCVPKHIVYEIYRRTEDYNGGYDDIEVSPMDYAVIDAKPFLYYLQYMSATDAKKKQAAATKLRQYCVFSFNSVSGGHIETTFNMFGHILELENKFEDAFNAYKMSVDMYPSNNAALWHLFRLLGQCVYGPPLEQKTVD
ncbi:hypothetical protein DPMN_103011 [Dreissena polymorpha]|uniref:Mab-21-like HhH/H2TH-like domain-containing protein n=3 Tax=Dreissena polymorpha TaxID=45954 RepID=A0A9D4H993_DREPO|nr:hypothetical protein DPMN_103011 [Dreissena polymorpha]